MKRREFVISTLGASFLSPLEIMADNQVTHLHSDDLSAQSNLENPYALYFMALGDWGRNGEDKQLEVGKQMGEWANSHRNNFVISVGDNFYPAGVVSEQDPLWHYSFENVYTSHSLQCDWFSVLGNHDYKSDPDAQIRYNKVSRRWKMPARYYTKEASLGANKGKALFVMIDTMQLLGEEGNENKEKHLSWIKSSLAAASSDVKWKIVVGHHPGYTVGPRIKNNDTLAIRAALTDIFEEYKVDVYLSGHEHSLQHLKPNGYTNHFVSGAGSDLTDVSANIPYSKFQASENGFMYFSLDSNRLNVKAINHLGAVLYETELKKG